MSLSLDSIYHPLNDFFLQKFAQGSAPTTFRFARLPRGFVDSDFITPGHPEWGPSQAVGDEQFSFVVDGTPTLDADARTVWVGPSRLSDLYNYEILSPATPFLPAGITDAEKQARIDAVSAAKTDALGFWEKTQATSILDGPSVKFRPSIAQPKTWWNKSDAGVWRNQAFDVKGAVSQPGQPQKPPDQILRMKVDDNVMRSILTAHIAAPAPAHPAIALSSPTLVMARPAFAAALAAPALTTAVGSPAAAAQPLRSVAIHDNLTEGIATLRFKQRIEIESLVVANSQTQPVTTSDVTISFDYCLVSITRMWFHDAFINNRSWCIPAQNKGQLSANDGHGMPALPVGFVAVKALKIQAPWTPQDITNLEQSVQFGPFNFDSKIVDGAIGHDGIQIIGWMLQTMPDLPPNAA